MTARPSGEQPRWRTPDVSPAGDEALHSPAGDEALHRPVRDEALHRPVRDEMLHSG